MIKIPYEQILQKIETEKGITKEKIEQKIQAKMEQLSGLISKEGAAHILANELGVKIGAPEGKVQIKQLLAGMRNVEIAAKILQKFDVREFQSGERKGKVGSFIVGDETGTIRVTCWNEQTAAMEPLEKNNIVKIENGFIRENRGTLELHLNDKSIITKDPEGVTIGEVKQVPTIGEPTRKNIAKIQENDTNIELLGTIVQVYDLKFFDRKDGATSYVTNCYLDDGTGNIRVAFFANQLQQLTKKSDEELQMFKAAPEGFQQIKTDLLGEMVKIVGRAKKNQMFETLEFVANRVDTDVNPEQEIQRLQEELEKPV
jgi:ssDNA-binding replication factor A large subunit